MINSKLSRESLIDLDVDSSDEMDQDDDTPTNCTSSNIVKTSSGSPENKLKGNKTFKSKGGTPQSVKEESSLHPASPSLIKLDNKKDDNRLFVDLLACASPSSEKNAKRNRAYSLDYCGTFNKLA